jgi:hypothetical protein
MTIDFSKLSISSQKNLYSALVAVENAFDTLEATLEESFGTIEEELTDLEAEVGEEYPLCELLGSLKAHVEAQTGLFDITENFSPEEAKAFKDWYEGMKNAD